MFLVYIYYKLIIKTCSTLMDKILRESTRVFKTYLVFQSINFSPIFLEKN